MTDKPLLGFIGQGYIGKNYSDDLERRGYTVVRYSLEEPYINNKEKIQDCDIVFIAVPTPTTPEGFDDSILREALELVGKGKLVVLKSTILPGTTMRLNEAYPDLTIFYSPEFLCEVTAAHDAANPFMNVIGVPEKTADMEVQARRVLNLLPMAPYSNICHCTEAEFIKYTHNTLGYIKIVHMNLLYDLMQKFGKEWQVVREAIEHDPMVTNYYNDPIHKSGRGAGGACFIKDYAALADMYRNMVDDPKGKAVWDAIEAKNIDLLLASKKDLDLLRGVYGEEILG